MDTNSLFIGILIGAVIAALIVYFYLKNSSIAKTQYDHLLLEKARLETLISTQEDKNSELGKSLGEAKIHSEKQASDLLNLNSNIASQNTTIQNQLDIIDSKNKQIDSLSDELKSMREENSRIKEENISFSEKIKNIEQTQREIEEAKEKLQEDSKNQFEILAQKILDEKAKSFSSNSEQNLQNILKPFQEKITEFKKTVDNTYEREARERFSLGEKVKELASLNQQISEDAKKLTRALKGESKTQGNWGEMILESILEKSGLVKGQEYFMEHQLLDENNKALYSEFSGKKMRPDAVVKYPDQRSVIIDSKVSLTAFSELVDEKDPELYELKAKQHLQSVKSHIQQLSQKAYDDYSQSLDFVMMFIPSEPAYIAAMQNDQNLWSFAYDRRILLLSPSNLITSLKLIADLWKREYQSKNIREIADRGSKLYSKFVTFVESLEKIGRNIELAKSNYDDAFKQLSTGRDNLIVQTQKMKDLGISSKKQLPQTLVDEAFSHDNTPSNSQENESI